ncbi:MAG: cysteinyl-tRNA synthetase [Patescibacteria group bacterium]|nr:cysteinyl-tRNA synthetase [Patescibacteria group bacterium]
MTSLPIYLQNTLTGKKELFTPITIGEVSMYHCGPTVYNYLHIGNLRAYILADTLRRMFEANGYKIHQVINITDVGHLTANNDEGLGDDGEDKIEKMAKASGKTALEIADYYTKVFFDDIHALGVQTAGTIFPKASEHIAEQLEMIKTLEEKGFTYKTSDGIYFDTSKYADYGKLGNINLKGLVEGARIGVNDEKKNITDFALWKFSATGVGANGKAVEKRFQEWESPWGVGYPGWHIECSAMSAKYLGNTFDIHTGGIDHIPVHHNNEIAQSESAHNGSPLAHYWLHNAFVNSDGKMSKSKGEFTRLVTLMEKGIAPVEYRYWLLQARYSSQLQYTEEAVYGAATGYKNLVAHVAKILISSNDSANTKDVAEAKDTVWNEILALINDDLNTPLCISKLWDILKDDSIEGQTKIEVIKKTDTLLGLDLIKNANVQIESEKASLVSPDEIPDTVKDLLEKRKSARAEKDWKSSDTLRDEVRDLGFEILDSESGQTLKKI